MGSLENSILPQSLKVKGEEKIPDYFEIFWKVILSLGHLISLGFGKVKEYRSLYIGDCFPLF